VEIEGDNKLAGVKGRNDEYNSELMDGGTNNL
jgi:hypothetical protein